MSNSKYNHVEEIEVERDYNVDSKKTFEAGQLPDVYKSWPYLYKPKMPMWYKFWKFPECCHKLNEYIREFRKITRLYINACHREINLAKNYAPKLINENYELRNDISEVKSELKKQEKIIEELNKTIDEKEIEILNMEKELNLYRKAYGKKGGGGGSSGTGGGWETTNSLSPK